MPRTAPVFAFASTLLFFALAVACRAPGPDAPEPTADAGALETGEDAGATTGPGTSPDVGTAHGFDAGGWCDCEPRQLCFPRLGCSYQCTECKVGACPEDGACEQGLCFYPIPECEGPSLPLDEVQVLYGEYAGCPLENDGRECALSHRLDFGGEVVELAVVEQDWWSDDWRATRVLGREPMPEHLTQLWRAAEGGGLWCQPEELPGSAFCASHQYGVHARAISGATSRGFGYGRGEGKRPSPAPYRALRGTWEHYEPFWRLHGMR